MKSIVLAVFASMVFAGAAYAGNGNDGDDQNGNGCEHDCGQGGGQGGDGGNGGDGGQGGAAVQGQGQVQGQKQTQVQGNVQVSQTTYEDAKNPASSAANLFLATCTSGASAQGFGGGGSLGGPDDVCLLLNFAQVAAAFGGDAGAEQSAWALREAQQILKIRANPLRKALQAIPLVGRIM